MGQVVNFDFLQRKYYLLRDTEIEILRNHLYAIAVGPF